uniref:RxLR effector candidate protein n=2 Tax=Hyaloperonospora arabidopsidis (strain Emoy2) TaxID=559515 RepID=M4C202_HYAAE
MRAAIILLVVVAILTPFSGKTSASAVSGPSKYSQLSSDGVTVQSLRTRSGNETELQNAEERMVIPVELIRPAQLPFTEFPSRERSLWQRVINFVKRFIGDHTKLLRKFGKRVMKDVVVDLFSVT